MRARVVVSVLVVFLIGTSLAASTVPQFGGTLRVEMTERIATIDPRQWPSAPGKATAAERLDSLVFDRLVRLDRHGTLQPALAISWKHDAQSKRWQFRLRDGVKFSDGTPLTPTIAALALQQLLGVSIDVSATSDSVVAQCQHASPDLLSELATGSYFIFHTAEDNSMTGTGPFRVAAWPLAGDPAPAVFVANDTSWEGRPFIDKIEIKMGADSQQQTNAISFGQADIVELPASEVRRAMQRGVRTASSDSI